MFFKKRILSLILCISMITGIIPLLSSVSGAGGLMAEIDYSDSVVYAGGLYDITVKSSDPESTYQWVVYYDTDRYVIVDDDEHYHGTKTDHFSFLTADGLYYGSGWEYLKFGCIVSAGGQSVATSAMTMHIRTHQDLLDDLEKDGMKITKFELSDTTFIEENEGILYYKAKAGNVISIDTAHPELDPKYEQSEIEIREEVYVLENNNLIKLDGSGHYEYTPYMVRDRALRIQYMLAVYINGIRFTTLDKRTARINTVTPDYESEAEAKQDGSVLKERYNESQKLGSFSKGSRVFVLEKGSTWSRVCAGSVIGYVPNTALEFYDTVGVIELNAQEPANLAEVSFDVTFGSDKYTLWSGPDAVTWYDKTAGTFLKEGDVFYKSHSYALDVWVETKDGALFKTDVQYNADVEGILNGESFPVNTAYGQVYNEVMSVYKEYTHVHDLEKVTQVNPTCTTDGKLTYYKCSCGARFADHIATVKITDDDWGIIPARGHKESVYYSNGKEHYKVCMRRECGQVISEYTGTHTGGSANCKNKALCSVCGLRYGPYGDHVYTEGSKVCLVCGSTDPDVIIYSDVLPGAFYFEAVAWADAYDITKGTSSTKFSPSAGCTRGQVVTFLWRAAGKPDPFSENCPFTDVDITDYYYIPVIWAVEQGITKGTSDTTFSPKSQCTRGQIVSFLWRAAGEPEPGSPYNPFVDVKTEQYFYSPVLWAVGKKITNGTDATHFSPSKTCTRGEVVTFMWRANN